MVRLDEGILALLERRAKREKRTVADLVREIIMAALGKRRG